MDNECEICGLELRPSEAMRCKTCRQGLREGIMSPPAPAKKAKPAEVKPVERASFTPTKKAAAKRR